MLNDAHSSLDNPVCAFFATASLVFNFCPMPSNAHSSFDGFVCASITADIVTIAAIGSAHGSWFGALALQIYKTLEIRYLAGPPSASPCGCDEIRNPLGLITTSLGSSLPGAQGACNPFG
eukprot:scaffold10342_cov67-Skeletonema_dohrnii-CCMP3373.AAC.1